MRKPFLILAILVGLVVGYFYFHNPQDLPEAVKNAGVAVKSAVPALAHPNAASRILPLIDGKLIAADGSPFRFPAKAPLASIRYFAIYYSAQWCPPCHTFTPLLVKWYRQFKPAHPNFELIFVSEDRNKEAMLGYMKEMSMPWPAVRFGDLKHDGGFKGSGIEKFAGSGIPDLVLVDADGKVLSDSFSWSSSYLGPQHVISDIEKLVPPPGVSASTPPEKTTPSPSPASSPETAKSWVPPAVMPAQPNWTWQTLDGKTYQNVVVTKIEPDTVSIVHSHGVAHVPINTLSPNIQKQLNYDPTAAAAARAESQRELTHPFYTMATRTEAQSVARQMHRPLAWVSSRKEDISASNSTPNTEIELTRMALNHLKDKSIIIFIDANQEMGQTPAIVHHQFSARDDGALPEGANYMPPKVVFSNPDADNILGRVSFTQMKAGGAAAIDEVLASIPKNQDVPPVSNGPTSGAPAPAPASPAPPPPTAAHSAPAPATGPSANTAKSWTPPDVMPAQPNWTWQTLDGKTYQNVVITGTEANTVTITHSMGVAHIPISLLPPDIQKKLNYEPHEAEHSAP